MRSLLDGPITVPTALERAGDFSELLGKSTPDSSTIRVLAASLEPEENYLNTALGIVPAGQNYLNAFPLPNILSGTDLRSALWAQEPTTLIVWRSLPALASFHS